MIDFFSLTEMQTGKIVRVNDRGFGFIAIEGQEKDLFFHANDLQDITFNDLKEGDVVTFEIEEGDKGPNATNVRRVEGEAPQAA